MDPPNFACFNKLPIEVRQKIWKLLAPERLFELCIEYVPRIKNQQTGIYERNPGAVVLRGRDGETDTQLQIAKRVVPSIPTLGIFLACKESREVATKFNTTKFNAEKDKVIVVDARLDRPPTGWVPGSGSYRPKVRELLDGGLDHGAFKEALRSPRHIADFVSEATVDGIRNKAEACYDRAWSRFPEMETFTAILPRKIEPHLWSAFTEEWRKCDTNLAPRMSPIKLLVAQDEFLFSSWIILDRRERYFQNKSEWEIEWKTIQPWGPEEGQRTPAKMEVVKRGGRAERRHFLQRFLGSEVGAREERIEWEAEVKWWGEAEKALAGDLRYSVRRQIY